MTEIVYKKVNMASKSILLQEKILLLEKYIGSCFPYSKKPATLVYNEYGKPCFEHYETKFNISHSGEYLVCAFCESEIGVDIQKIHDVNLNIAKRFFTYDESEYIFSKPENERANAFFRLWVLKESFVKVIGKGLSMPLNSFNITFNSEKPRVFCESLEDKYSFIEYDFFEGYKTAVCVKENQM